MLQSAKRLSLCLLMGAGLIGCGTYVPSIQEIPGTPGEGERLVHAIVRSINCELRDAVRDTVNKDKELAILNGRRMAKWFDTWGVQTSLTLTIVETSEVNPTVSWTPNPITMLFTLAGGIDASSEATRTDTLGFFYTVDELVNDTRRCTRSATDSHPIGSFLIDSDLRIREWLIARLNLAEDIKQPNSKDTPQSEDTPKDKNVLSHGIKFQVVTSGTINPSWKLTRVTVNTESKGPLLSLKRDRTHDVIFTFGPAEPNEKKTLTGAAQSQFVASQVGQSISTQLRNLLR